MIENVMNKISDVPNAHVNRINENKYEIGWTGALFKALDKQIQVEGYIKRKLSDKYNIKIIYGEGLEATFIFEEK